MVSYEENLRVPGSFQPLNGHEEGLGLIVLDSCLQACCDNRAVPGRHPIKKGLAVKARPNRQNKVLDFRRPDSHDAQRMCILDHGFASPVFTGFAFFGCRPQ